MTLQGPMTALLMGLLSSPAQVPVQAVRARTTLGPHDAPVLCLAFSPDSRFLATGSVDGDANVWDIATGKLVRSLTTFDVRRVRGESIISLAFSPDGRLLAAGATNSISVWEAATGKRGASLASSAGGNECLGFVTGDTAVAAGDYREVKVWDIATLKEVRSFGRIWSRSIAPAFSPDGKTVAVGFYQDMDLWDPATGKKRLTLPDHPGETVKASFSADGKIVAVGYSRQESYRKVFFGVKLWDANTGTLLRSLPEKQGYLWRTLLSPDGKTVAVLDAKYPTHSNDLTLLDGDTGRAITTVKFNKAEESPHCIAFSPDGKLLAAGCRDGTIRLWDVVPSKHD
jgi:WD40 repeat protein